MSAADLGRAAVTLARTFGARGARQRAVFELRRAAGLLRSEPRAVRSSVAALPIPAGWPFVPDADRLRSATNPTAARERADRVLGGEHHAYRWTWTPRPRSADDWRALEPEAGGAEAPWFHDPPTNGHVTDIKDSWEPARFSWAYDLARGWMLARDDRHAAELWRSLSVFVEACPPYRGVQWGCGQETAIRAIALLWAEGALADAPSSDARALGTLRTVLAWSGERIADAIDYGLSQRNNHGISEAAGLIAIGGRLRGADPRARQWLELGTHHLAQCIEDQFEPDGWYLQHSLNYLRVALDQIVIAQRVLRHCGGSLDEHSLARARSAVALLAEVCDPRTGEPPLHGANDGAWVLPLSTAAYRDFRPALTASAATLGATLRGDMAPDPETLAWLGAPPPASGAVPAVPRIRVGQSGWAHGVTGRVRFFARAGAYRSRPGHIDAMHVDVWIDGRAAACDAGTYRYAAPPPWRNGLAGESVHNGLTLAEHPLARRGPRFLWLSWPNARVDAYELRHDGTIVVRMVNDSWDSLGIRHERCCEAAGGGLLVIDRLTVPDGVQATPILHWLVDGEADDISMVASGDWERRDVVGGESSVEGWISEGYGHKREARSVQLHGSVKGGRFVAVTAFGDARDASRLRARLAHDLAP